MTTPTSPPTTASRVLARAGVPLGAGAALVVAGALARYGLDLAQQLSPATKVDTFVVLAITLMGALGAAWAGLHLLVASACLLGAACGRRWRAGERLVAAHGPALVRRGMAAALGASIGLGGMVAASASSDAYRGLDDAGAGAGAGTSLSATATTGRVDATAATWTDEELSDLGWVPTPEIELVSTPVDTPTTDDDSPTADEAAGDPAPKPEHGDRRYVVTAGDTLWSVTDDLLGGADDARVAAAWPELYEANRDVVGSDPNLIHPGQELAVPTVLEELS